MLFVAYHDDAEAWFLRAPRLLTRARISVPAGDVKSSRDANRSINDMPHMFAAYVAASACSMRKRLIVMQLLKTPEGRSDDDQKQRAMNACSDAERRCLMRESGCQRGAAKRRSFFIITRGFH